MRAVYGPERLVCHKPMPPAERRPVVDRRDHLVAIGLLRRDFDTSDRAIRALVFGQATLVFRRLLFIGGLRSIYRETSIAGSMGYASAPLSAGFLLIL